MVGTGQREIECRWLAPDSRTPAWLFTRALHIARELGLGLGPLSRRRLDDRYLETAEDSLEARGFALRLRRSDDGRVLALKARGQTEAVPGAIVCSDFEAEIPWPSSPPTDLAQLPEDWCAVLGLPPTGALRQVLRLQQVRYAVHLGDQGQAVLTVDRVLRPYVERRVELEVNQWTSRWSEFTERLADSLDLTPTDVDKVTAARMAVADRARAHSNPETPTGSQTNDRGTSEPDELVVLTPSAGDLLQPWLEEPWSRLERAIERFLDRPKPKLVRRVRVAVRHLRTRLAVLHALAPLDGRGRPMRTLKAQAGKLGELRDLEVALARFDRPRDGRPSMPGDTHETLRRRLDRTRDDLRQEQHERLSSARHHKRMHRLAGWLGEVATRPIDATLGDAARVSVPRAVERLRQSIDRAVETGWAEDVHATRLRTKRLRYLLRAFRFAARLEFVEARLVPIQDTLGALQDAETTREWILASVEDPSHDPMSRLALGAFLQRETEQWDLAFAASSSLLLELRDTDWTAFDPDRWSWILDPESSLRPNGTRP